MIEVKNLTKYYGRFKAIDNISFEVQKGKILGILGPNGAGKTTVMNIISGYKQASTGNVIVAGIDVDKAPQKVACHIGYLPENPPLYSYMRVKDFLKFCAKIRKVTKTEDAVNYAMEATNISDRKNDFISSLSKGYKQRVGLASAILHKPDILILDEPTVGLDPKQIIETRNLIKHFTNSHTVILSTHILSEVQILCTHVAIMNSGKIVDADSIESLQNKAGLKNKIRIEIKGNKKEIEKELKLIEDIDSIENIIKEKNIWVLEAKNEAKTKSDILKKAVEKKWEITEIRTEENSLENLFSTLIG